MFMFSEVVYDLMQASLFSMTDDNNLYIEDGEDGFPAFGFRPGSEVKQPYRLYLPQKLPAEFTLVATFKPTSFRTSYLFAVLNPFETVVQLGIRISVSYIIIICLWLCLRPFICELCLLKALQMFIKTYENCIYLAELLF